MAGYTVVQFTEWGNGKSVLAVPCSWLVKVENRLMCYFPKTDSKRAIRNQLPVRGDWECHAVRRLAFKDIANYETALLKEKRAMDTSGIDSSADENVNANPSSRKRQRPPRYSDGVLYETSDSGRFKTASR
jgi:hypothetical protein